MAWEVAPPSLLFGCLDTEQIQLFFALLEQSDWVHRYNSTRQVLKSLRQSFASECGDIVNSFQREDADRATRKKSVLQSEVRCIYDIVKRRETDVSEVQSTDIQKIIADLIDKCQTELDTERQLSFAEMERLLCVPSLFDLVVLF